MNEQTRKNRRALALKRVLLCSGNGSSDDRIVTNVTIQLAGFSDLGQIGPNMTSFYTLINPPVPPTINVTQAAPPAVYPVPTSAWPGTANNVAPALVTTYTQPGITPTSPGVRVANGSPPVGVYASYNINWAAQTFNVVCSVFYLAGPCQFQFRTRDGTFLTLLNVAVVSANVTLAFPLPPEVISALLNGDEVAIASLNAQEDQEISYLPDIQAVPRNTAGSVCLENTIFNIIR